MAKNTTTGTKNRSNAAAKAVAAAKARPVLYSKTDGIKVDMWVSTSDKERAPKFTGRINGANVSAFLHQVPDASKPPFLSFVDNQGKPDRHGQRRDQHRWCAQIAAKMWAPLPSGSASRRT